MDQEKRVDQQQDYTFCSVALHDSLAIVCAMVLN